MLIRVWVDERDPPSGRVEVEGGEPEVFSGWLGLLKVLSEVLNLPLARPSPRGEPAQPPAAPGS